MNRHKETLIIILPRSRSKGFDLGIDLLQRVFGHDGTDFEVTITLFRNPHAFLQRAGDGNFVRTEQRNVNPS